MGNPMVFDGSLDELPAMLKIEEAARVLRIGRSLAYQLATRYLDSGGIDGLPVLPLGGVLRVPGFALRELIMTGTVVQLTGTPTTQSRTPTSRPRRGRRNAPPDRAQLSLLSAD